MTIMTKNTKADKTNDRGAVARSAAAPTEELAPPSYAEARQQASTSGGGDGAAAAASSQVLPIVIPQVARKPRHAYIAPFVRASPPPQVLASKYGLSDDAFLRFVDGVNKACTAPPALQAVQLTDSLTNIGPLGVLKSVSLALNTLAGASGKATGYTRTLSCVKKANADVFAPRGLHVCIVTTSKMLGLIDEHARQQQLQLGPPQQPPYDERLSHMHALLQGRTVAELDVDVTPLKPSKSMLDKVNAWQAKQDEQRTQKRASRQELRAQRRGYSRELGTVAEGKQKASRELRWIVIMPVAKKQQAAVTEEDDVDLGSENGDDDDVDDDSEEEEESRPAKR